MGEKVVEEFSGLVTDRILPIEMISKIVILAEGALWKHRMIRRPSNTEKREKWSSRLAVTESNIVTHLIATHRVLLGNGIVELAEAPPDDAAEGDLAQRITATFRRTLPALRMAGKWLRSNTRYLSQGLKPSVNGDEDAGVTKDAKGRGKRNSNPTITIDGIDEFWHNYARFSTSLINSFPVEKLPELRTQLEEDIDMAGFLPLRKYMTGSDGKPLGTSRRNTADGAQVTVITQEPREQSPLRDQVHPNEEQLMRIADILTDAKAIAADAVSRLSYLRCPDVNKSVQFTPVSLDECQFTLGPSSSTFAANAVETRVVETRPERLSSTDLMERHLPTAKSDEEEDAASVTTRTDDDPVHLAFEIGLGPADTDTEDDDRVVWRPGYVLLLLELLSQPLIELAQRTAITSRGPDCYYATYNPSTSASRPDWYTLNWPYPTTTRAYISSFRPGRHSKISRCGQCSAHDRTRPASERFGCASVSSTGAPSTYAFKFRCESYTRQ